MSGTASATWFWQDWFSDLKLKQCSEAARGIWMDMLCIAAQSPVPGHVLFEEDGKPVKPTTQQLKDTCSWKLSIEALDGLINELKNKGVCDVNRGVIVSRRLVRDYQKRRRNSEGGHTRARTSARNERGNFTGWTGAHQPGAPATKQNADPAGVTSAIPFHSIPESPPTPPPGEERAAAGQGALERLMDMLGIADRSPGSMLRASRALQDFLAEGLSFDLDLLPEAEAVHARGQRQEPITSLKFIARGARDRRTWRSSQNGHTPSNGATGNGFAHRSDDEWRKIVWWFRTSGQWHQTYPPTEQIGQYGASEATALELASIKAKLLTGEIAPLPAEQLHAMGRA